MPPILPDCPLLQNMPDDREWLIHREGSLTSTELRQRIQACAEALPEKKQAILLSEQPLNFFISFMAAQSRGQTVLLPPDRSPATLAEIAAHYPDSYSLHDDVINASATLSASPVTKLNIETEHVAAMLFTSGSTARPTAQIKTWGSLVQGAQLTLKRFGFTDAHCLVATVPAQHMYGLEMTVMLPWLAGVKLYAERPFYPDDVRQALLRCSGKRVLITTPLHLRACVNAGLRWPKLDQVISATATLDSELCAQAAFVFSAPVREIFGCTETGALASRDPMQGEDWLLYERIRLFSRNGDSIISAPHLDTDEVKLADRLEILSPTRFRLLGRHHDMVNIAGKRASLAELNNRLNAIPGISDGVFFMPETQSEKTSRLVAFVVADFNHTTINDTDILSALAAQLDPVFLPRPLYRLKALPRNETGKLPRQALLDLLETLSINKTCFKQAGIIDKNHPSLAGHFPAHPIVPGVVLLDRVREAMKAWQPQLCIRGFKQIKFHAPLFPDQSFMIELQKQKEKYHFRCQREDTLIASGIMSAITRDAIHSLPS